MRLVRRAGRLVSYAGVAACVAACAVPFFDGKRDMCRIATEQADEAIAALDEERHR